LSGTGRRVAFGFPEFGSDGRCNASLYIRNRQPLSRVFKMTIGHDMKKTGFEKFTNSCFEKNLAVNRYCMTGQ